MEGCTTIIGQQPAGEKKDLLEKLQSEADTLIKALPEDQKETTANILRMLVTQATAKTPDCHWYSVSAQELSIPISTVSRSGPISRQSRDSTGADEG